jgi:hypothetical protein
MLFDEYDRGVCYQIRRIHGLPIVRRRVDDNFYLYDEVMQRLYDMFKNADLIGYKGGTIERNMLNKMCVNSINLEVLGCPKYSLLLSKYGVEQHTCGYHLRNGDVYHCSGHKLPKIGNCFAQICQNTRAIVLLCLRDTSFLINARHCSIHSRHVPAQHSLNNTGFFTYNQEFK